MHLKSKKQKILFKLFILKEHLKGVCCIYPLHKLSKTYSHHQGATFTRNVSKASTFKPEAIYGSLLENGVLSPVGCGGEATPSKGV